MNIKPISSFSEWIKLYRLYKKAFPRYERKPLWLIIRTYKKKKTDIWIIESENKFSGLAITLNCGEFILLDYFAVSSEKRGSGLGGKALRKLQEEYSCKRFFLEIESTVADCNNREERLRRKKFYLNNNMSETGLMVDLFGTEMEILGYKCTLSFDEYLGVYKENFGKIVNDKIKNITEK